MVRRLPVEHDHLLTELADDPWFWSVPAELTPAGLPRAQSPELTRPAEVTGASARERVPANGKTSTAGATHFWSQDQLRNNAAGLARP